MNVLILNNNFYGSYGSNQIFFKELCKAFKLLGITIFTAETVSDAKLIYEKVSISFSICFSKYFYFDEKQIPLYDLYKTINYQWVSDNPLKMNLDTKSKYIKYIFIDEEYADVIPTLFYEPLILPLGYLEEKVKPFVINKENNIIVPCKIRNINSLKKAINENYYRDKLWEFIKSYNYDTSFIKHFVKYTDEIKIKNTEEFFRIANEYIRVDKRIKVVKALANHDITLLCEDTGNFNDRKIKYINPIEYEETNNIINSFNISINVDPNYYACVHDRFIKTISSGSGCITNRNKIIESAKLPCYSFNDINSINDIVEEFKNNIEEQYYKELSFITNFSWRNSVELIIENFKNNKRINSYEL